MLMYGSNFWRATFRPRATSRRPMEAAAMPLPSDETTPPVTKMKRVRGRCSAMGCLSAQSRARVGGNFGARSACAPPRRPAADTATTAVSALGQPGDQRGPSEAPLIADAPPGQRPVLGQGDDLLLGDLEKRCRLGGREHVERLG